MPATHGNLFAALPPPGASEAFEPLLEHPRIRVERIVSDRHASPPGFWYDQAHTEWVALIQGDAVIAFADGRRHAMRAGDWLTIPAHSRHRVESTAPATIWLAIHIEPETPA